MYPEVELSHDEEVRVCHDISGFATRFNRHRTAKQYLDKALNLKRDAQLLFERATWYRRSAQPQKALEDARAAEELSIDNYLLKMEIVKAIYELNELELSTLETCEWIASGQAKSHIFEEHNNIVKQNLSDCLGKRWEGFIVRNRRVVAMVAAQEKRQKEKDMRPLWKIKRDQGKCDVGSQIEKELTPVHPLQLQKRQRTYKIFNEYYLGKSAIDVDFLKDLRNNGALFLSQSRINTPILRECVNSDYDAIKRTVKMLHVRSPLYNETPKRFPNTKIHAQHRRNFLYCIQYQTRRDMHIVLKTIHWLKRFRPGEIRKVSRYVEGVMSKVAATKSDRIMPWKFVFINEVYNLLGLIYIDRIILRFDFAKEYEYDTTKLLHLLGVEPLVYDFPKSDFVFGDKSTSHYRPTYDIETHRKYLDHLDNRIRFAKYPIEGAYLYHELARTLFRRNLLEDSIVAARKSVREAESCNSYLWQFLGVMHSVKVFALREKTDDCIKALEQATALANKLKHPVLCALIETCLRLNKEIQKLSKHDSVNHNSVRLRRASTRPHSRDTITSLINSLRGSNPEAYLKKPFKLHIKYVRPN